MFERKKYKNFAKKQLAGRWGIPVLVTVVIVIISTVFSIPDVMQLYKSGYFTALFNGNYADAAYAIDTASSTSFITSIINMVVSAIVDVAAIGLYIKMSRSPEPVYFSDFIEGFNNWARATLAVLWQFLWIFLWTLLFIIPGIIKSIAYSQMFYIIAEYKEVSVSKAMRISIEITKGHKLDLFIMYLSFLGWAFLSVFTLGILYFWLLPYMNMTYVNAYHALMKEALESGRIKPEDLSE
ncbi:DUF975 family protein [Treponema bryantii]|uniref:DUF975 family protein n=1 Tax=Treponema bryantii TaxID=163 RepID=UPI002B2A4734|nr:membrane protein [Treponema bryantii]